jgi:hypothetical protein
VAQQYLLLRSTGLLSFPIRGVCHITSGCGRQ